MPPFINTKCPECQHSNRFDLAELRKRDGSVFKYGGAGPVQTGDELEVICQNCGRRFKFTLKGGSDGRKK
jgi:RNase P subunit RPR2